VVIFKSKQVRVKMREKDNSRLKLFDKRIRTVQILFIFFIGALIINFICLQLFDVRNYKEKAKYQRRGGVGHIMRGSIYDRNGMKLATDMVMYKVYAIRNDFNPNIRTEEDLARILSPILKIPQSELLTKLKRNEPVILLKKNVDRKTKDAITKLTLREISVEKMSVRTYPQGALASHILGYYNPEADISAGIEYTARDILTDAQRPLVEKTPRGDILYGVSTDPIAATTFPKGKDVTLTIDTAIQHICETELNKVISKFKALRGSVIVLDPKTGEILAYAVYPYYDPNSYKNASMLQLKNWTLTDIYPPGSTFKIITIAAAMELGKINEHSKILDTGKIKVGWWPISNYDYRKNPSPGWIDLVYLFQHSSNVASVKVAQSMTKQEFFTMLKKFGFGTKMGIDLPGESTGLLKPVSKWDSSDHASMGYGYATSVTAIQMAAAVAAIANNGVWITPHVIKYSPAEEAKKIKKIRVMSEENAKIVTKLLAKSVNNGNTPLKLDNYNVSAKTGTSRRPNENGAGYSNKLYTSVVGYFPSKDPQVLIYIVVDSAQGGEIWGNTVAAPVFREIATQITHILNLVPDKVQGAKK